jgi:restriction system protein
MTERGCWVVRGGDDNELIELLRQQGLVAIGWFEIGSLEGYDTSEKLREAITKTYADWSSGKVSAALGQLAQFRFRMKEGDLVATPIRATREIMIGKITGSYEYRPDRVSATYPNVRKVTWAKTVSRDVFSREAKNSLGSIRTVFSVASHRDEFERILGSDAPSAATAPGVASTDEVEEIEGEDRFTFDGIQEGVADRISDFLVKIPPYEFQRLVGGVLEAMGYHVQVWARGRDGGIDVVAYPDPLGVETPRIQVQVKHQQATVGGPAVRELIGLLRSGDRGLFISTGGFTKDAENEAARSDRPISLVNWDRFVELLHDHYEELDPEFKATVPLKRIWVLAPPKTE